VGTKKDKVFRVKRQVERNSRLTQKETDRSKKIQINNEVSLRELHFRINSERSILENEKNNLLKELHDIRMIDIEPSTNLIKIPGNFSFCNNYDECFPIIREFASAIYHHMGEQIILDFSNCKNSDTPALFMLQVIRLEILEMIKQIQVKLRYHHLIPQITIRRSQSKNVSRLLTVTGFIPKEPSSNTNDDSNLEPIDDLGYLKGSKPQKHYAENKKAPYTKKVVEYINECLLKHGYCFGIEGVNMFEGIVGEVLSNAEDHSIYPNWYITANFSQEDFNAGPNFKVGEVNLTILNFGLSMYDAFYSTKDDNDVMFSSVENFVSEMLENHPKSKFSSENIFTMALLQDQVSRLKFADESRGTGTIKFINSFLDLGDFANKERGYTPNLSIFTGKTHISCDNTCKPFLKHGLYCLALNVEQDLKVPPDKAYLKQLNQAFPGTLISVKIYLNKAHLDRKYAPKS